MVNFKKYLNEGIKNGKDLYKLIPLSLIFSLSLNFSLIQILTNTMFEFNSKLKIFNFLPETSYNSPKVDLIILGDIFNFQLNVFSYNFFVIVLIFSIVFSGLLGSMNDYQFNKTFNTIDNIKKYFIEFFKFFIILNSVLLFLLLIKTSNYFLEVITLAIIFLIGYVCYGIPFFIINLNLNFRKSFVLSLGLAFNFFKGGNDYRSFGLKFIGSSLVFTFLFILLGFYLGWIGIAISSIFLGIVVLILTNSALYFFKHLTSKMILN